MMRRLLRALFPPSPPDYSRGGHVWATRPAGPRPVPTPATPDPPKPTVCCVCALPSRRRRNDHLVTACPDCGTLYLATWTQQRPRRGAPPQRVRTWTPAGLIHL